MGERWLAVSLVLAACAGGRGLAASPEEPDPPPEDAGSQTAADGTVSEPDAGSRADVVGEGDAGPRQGAEDASRPDAAGEAGIKPRDAAFDALDPLAPCRQQACATAGAQCGPIVTQCGGQPVDCGSCKPLQELCGDNDFPGQCGSYCWAQGWENQCVNAQPYAPGVWAVRTSCSGRPYRWVQGQFVERDASTADCVQRTFGIESIWCCP